jgi:hypothetical protein
LIESVDCDAARSQSWKEVVVSIAMIREAVDKGQASSDIGSWFRLAVVLEY